MPNIKPFRDYDPHDVINLFAIAAATGSKGTFVQPSVFNPSNHAGYTNIGVGAEYDGTWSKRFAVNARVVPAISGQAAAIGMTLYDTVENDSNGVPVRFSPQYVKDANSWVGSGEAVPILTRGLVEISGFIGAAGPGSGAYLAVSAGDITVGLPNLTGGAIHLQKIGNFLSSTGADGYALLMVRL